MGAESADSPQTLEPDPASTGEGSRDSSRTRSCFPSRLTGGSRWLPQPVTDDCAPGSRPRPWRTIDIITAAMIGVVFGVAYWGWSSAYNTPPHAVHQPPRPGSRSARRAVADRRRRRRSGRTPTGRRALRRAAGRRRRGDSRQRVGLGHGDLRRAAGARRRGRARGLPVPPVQLARRGARRAPWLPSSSSCYEWHAYWADTTAGWKLGYVVFFMLSGAVVAGIGGWALIQRARRHRRDRRPPGRTGGGPLAGGLSPDWLERAGADVGIDRLTWTPTRRRSPVLADITLEISAGERVLLAGPSGAGKSTLLRAMAGLLLTADHGDLEGAVRISGRTAGSEPGASGLLLQDPTAAVIAETAGRDVAFGLENRRVRRDEIWPAVERALDESQFPYGADRLTSALSGGELQRLALAGCVALDPRLLLLDEPTSMLDPEGADSVRAAIKRVVAERRATLVVVEHRLEPWLDFVDRLIVLEAGAVVADGRPDAVLEEHGERLAASGVWTPGAATPRPLSLDVETLAPSRRVEGIRSRDDAADCRALRRPRRSARPPHRAARGRLGRRSGPSRRSHRPQRRGKVDPPGRAWRRDPPHRRTRRGRGGAGDLARLIAVAVEVARSRGPAGMDAAGRRAGHRRRRPSATRSKPSGRAIGLPTEWLAARAESLIDQLGLTHLAEASPYHLSGGEQRRLMVAAALAHGPTAVLLDEPTVGQDRNTWAAVVGALASARDAGAGVALSTHDAARRRCAGSRRDRRSTRAGGSDDSTAARRRPAVAARLLHRAGDRRDRNPRRPDWPDLCRRQPCRSGLDGDRPAQLRPSDGSWRDRGGSRSSCRRTSTAGTTSTRHLAPRCESSISSCREQSWLRESARAPWLITSRSAPTCQIGPRCPASAALARIDGIGETWRQISRARRARGWGSTAGRGSARSSGGGCAFGLLVVEHAPGRLARRRDGRARLRARDGADLGGAGAVAAVETGWSSPSA